MIDVLIDAVFVAYGLFVVGVVAHALYRLQRQSDNSVAHNLGRTSGYLALAVRNPRVGVVAIVGIVIALLVLSSIQLGESNSTPDNRPPIAPVHADNLRMPTMYPFERRRTVAPPFIGHRFALGDGL